MATTVLAQGLRLQQHPTTLVLPEQQANSQENLGGLSGRLNPMGAPNNEEYSPLDRAFNEFKKVCNLMTSKQQSHIFSQLHEAQKSLAEEEGAPRFKKISRSATCSYAFGVTAEKIYVLGDIIAQGASTTVYYSREIDTTRGTPEKAIALKDREGDFEAEKAVLNQLNDNSMNGPGRIHNELFEACFKGDDNKYYAINSPSEGTLVKEDYRQKTYPATETIQQFIDYFSGLGTLHESDLIHRNITIDTLLCNANKLTGYEGVTREHTEEKRHETWTHPFYAAPFIWNNILGQKERVFGKQTKKADLFAMGRVIQYDVIPNILDQLGGQQMEPIIERIAPENWTTPTLSTDPLSNHYILELEQQHPNRVIYTGQDSDGNDVCYVFPTNDEAYRATLQGIKLLKGTLSDLERGRLGDLANFACELQNNDPTRIPNYAEAQDKLRVLLQPPQSDSQEGERQTILENLIQEGLPEEQQAHGAGGIVNTESPERNPEAPTSFNGSDTFIPETPDPAAEVESSDEEDEVDSSHSGSRKRKSPDTPSSFTTPITSPGTPPITSPMMLKKRSCPSK